MREAQRAARSDTTDPVGFCVSKGVAVALVLPPATSGGRLLFQADAQNFVIALNAPKVH